MPRIPRPIVPDYPHHVIQRGHNRQVVFSSDEDYLYYLDNLREFKEQFGCRVYAYCLMTNHIHLIIDPGEKPNNLAQLIKRLAGRQTRYINKMERRTGSLWEGRYKSSPISTDEYLLACSRYIELNPVRAGIVSDPSEYRWSSYSSKIGEKKLEWLDYDPCYMGLAGSDKERVDKYADWVKSVIPDGELELIRRSLQRGQLTGGSRFVDEVEGKIERRIEFRGQGRPRKQ